MLKNKKILLSILVVLLLLLVPNMVNAAVEVTRNKYASDGSMKFIFTGLELDTTHEYEFGLSKTTAEEISKWYSITEYTNSDATVNITVQTDALRKIIQAVDTGYVTIKDKTETAVILEDYPVDLSSPYLEITNYTVLNNGKEFKAGAASSECIHIYLRNPYEGTPYYQYEKITDKNIIEKYKEIKANNGSFKELEKSLKATPPTSGWTQWKYFNGYGEITGWGYPANTIEVAETGLFYMWIYFSGDGIKPLYGYILVDNLEPEIALDSISLPKTKTVELGKTLTLTPTFSPANTTNKIVTWSSSDESVATVDNAGKITPKKVGSTIITVTSQDGNKKANCTVTVTEVASNNKEETKKEEQTNTNNNINNKTDSTTAPGNIPYTGGTFAIIVGIIGIVGVGIYTYKRNKDLKGI